jgi:hypothetical protein
MLPKVVLQQFVSFFQFARDGQTRKGVSYQGRLYELVEKFSVSDRMAAYELGYQLMRQGEDVIITVSANHYSLWSPLTAETRSIPSNRPSLVTSGSTC